MADIQTITMPKWGLAMTEGMVAEWHVEPGAEIASGEEIMDIETSKITNAFESPVAGTLRRIVVEPDAMVPVGALLGIVAEDGVADADIDAFIERFNEAFEAQAAEAEVAVEPEYADAGGRRIRYLQAGEGDEIPVVMIHGFGGDLNSWMFNQPDLAADRAVYAIDLPGHGGSEKQVGVGDVGELSATVLAFMDALGIETAHLVGHSLGGAIALGLALNHAGRVASVTGLCTAGLGPDINMDYIDGFIGAGRRKQLKPVLEMLVHDPGLITRDMLDEVLKFKRLDGAEAALNAIATAAFDGGRQVLQLTAKLDALAVPAQVIWGSDDRIVPASHADGLPDTVAVHVLMETGHLAHMERANDVNKLIGDFIEGHGSRAVLINPSA